MQDNDHTVYPCATSVDHWEGLSISSFGPQMLLLVSVGSVHYPRNHSAHPTLVSHPPLSLTHCCPDKQDVDKAAAPPAPVGGKPGAGTGAELRDVVRESDKGVPDRLEVLQVSQRCGETCM